MKGLSTYQANKLADYFLAMAHRAQTEHEKWEGTKTTYCDTDMLAADVEYGREEAWLAAYDAIVNELNKSDDTP